MALGRQLADHRERGREHARGADAHAHAQQRHEVVRVGHGEPNADEHVDGQPGQDESTPPQSVAQPAYDGCERRLRDRET